MSSTDPTTIKTLQRADQARRVLAGAQNMLRASPAAAPDIDDLVETGTLVAFVTEQLAEVNMRMIGAALPRCRPPASPPLSDSEPSEPSARPGGPAV
jgi:hypothetical protein